MSPLPLFVEIIDRRGHIISRTRIENLPATIGRSYDSTIIVDDEFVAAKHVQIEADESGAMLAKDLGSQNGMHAVALSRSPSARLATIALGGHSTTEFLIGKSRVRVVPATAPVAPEKVLTVERTVPLYFVWGSIAALLAMLGFESWFGMVDEVKPLAIITTLLSLLGALFVWAGGWAFITRLMRGAPKFAPHLLVATAGAILFMVSSVVIDALGFMFNLSALYKWRGVLAVAMGAALLAAHVYLANGALSKGMSGFIALAALGVLSMSFLTSYQSHKTISPGGFMSSVFPPSWQLSGSKSPDDFFSRVQQDKVEVDGLRALEGEQDGPALE